VARSVKKLNPTETRLATISKAANAAEQAWDWIVSLQQQAKGDPDAADAELNELFRAGSPVRGLDGPTEGILVMTTTNPLLDTAAKAVTALWMPWQGKRFNAATGEGDNRMTDSSALVTKLLWPLYSMKDAAEGRLAFDFKTYVEAGKDDPDREVMVIDYSDVEKNPRLVIRSIRDELVELVPGTFLGKILFRTRSGSYSKIGYFALRIPR
jgi:hypothetical protein